MDIALAIEYIQEGSEYEGSTTANTEECYDELIWTDKRIPKPTWAEIQAAWGAIKDIPEEKPPETIKIESIEAEIEEIKARLAALEGP